MTPLRARLNGVKGGTAWTVVAGQAGVHYDTVARIARGSMKNPGAAVCERLFAALDALEAPPATRPTDTARSPHA